MENKTEDNASSFAVCHSQVGTIEIVEYGKVKAIDNTVPVFKHRKGDAGYDVFVEKDTWIFPFKVTRVMLNCCVELPPGYFARVSGRSGETLKGNVTIEGTIDHIYRGQISALMTRIGILPRKIKKGTKVAQLIVIPYAEMHWQYTNQLTKTERGHNGFGSTGN